MSKPKKYTELVREKARFNQLELWKLWNPWWNSDYSPWDGAIEAAKFQHAQSEALISKQAELIEVLVGALEKMDSGFGGMFGTQSKTLEEEAMEMCPEIITEAIALFAQHVKDLEDAK